MSRLDRITAAAILSSLTGDFVNDLMAPMSVRTDKLGMQEFYLKYSKFWSSNETSKRKLARMRGKKFRSNRGRKR